MAGNGAQVSAPSPTPTTSSPHSIDDYAPSTPRHGAPTASIDTSLPSNTPVEQSIAIEPTKPTAPAPLGVAQATALTPSAAYPTPENADRGNKRHEAEVKHGIDIKYPVAMQSYDPQDMNFTESHLKSWTAEQMAKEYDRLAETYMALRHEHISALVDQDSNEKDARRQVVDSRQSLANGAQKLLWNSEAAFEASKAIAGRICQPFIWTDPQTQTQYTGKAPGSFTPQEAQTILNLYKDDCIKNLKGVTLAATGANLEEFGIDETIVAQAYDLPGDRSWFEKIGDNWKDAARDVLVDSSMDLSIIEEAPLRRQVSFPSAHNEPSP
ncbi:hypothetical protein J4E86_003671 [Alternaria arbusti]|uniref:uncharacterized protein n=1 Tax=Alternaria arbusti TaxID=232088 RepID=UPI00221FE966|nr:uncharacterized protein J4E86_003671 [Alternaria arbusti]KAI4958076.1 hypothetical protein J4E86_003671 [Alternaria arbusti]